MLHAVIVHMHAYKHMYAFEHLSHWSTADVKTKTLEEARRAETRKKILNVLAEMLALIKTMRIKNQPPLLHFMVYIIRKSGGGY